MARQENQIATLLPQVRRELKAASDQYPHLGMSLIPVRSSLNMMAESMDIGPAGKKLFSLMAGTQIQLVLANSHGDTETMSELTQFASVVNQLVVGLSMQAPDGMQDATLAWADAMLNGGQEVVNLLLQREDPTSLEVEEVFARMKEGQKRLQTAHPEYLQELDLRAQLQQLL